MGALAAILFTSGLSAKAEEGTLPYAQPLGTVLEAAGDQRGRFVLTSGRTVIGRIAKTDGDTLWVRKPSGGLMALSLADIAKVRIREISGDMVEGDLLQMADGGLGWQPVDLDEPDGKTDAGGPLVRVDKGLLRRDQTRLVQTADLQPAKATSPAAEQPPNEPTDGGSLPRLIISADQGGEKEGEVRFRLTLSEPAKGSILIIYSTMDGSAKAPGDYSHGQGVVVFEPGQKETIITASIVDDTMAEGDETLSIFITADPAAVMIGERKAAATISDND